MKILRVSKNVLSLRLQKKSYFHSWTKDFVKYSDEVSEGFQRGHPMVALESTLITHGLPHPQNFNTACRLEEIVRQNRAIPATIGIIDGIVHIGMSKKELEMLAHKNTEVLKISRRDLPFVLSQGMSGGTTVAATMILAHKAGIRVFATGGIGGVHRGGEKTMDVSADLFELSQTPMTVVSAGVKSILDIGRTLEYLETLGVCVASLGPSKSFPAFFTPESGHPAPCHLTTPQQAAALIDCRDRLELKSGILLGVPIPQEFLEEGRKTEAVIEDALLQAREDGIGGREVTPYVLNKVRQLSEGASLKANIGLLENNAKVGSQVAVQLHELKSPAIPPRRSKSHSTPSPSADSAESRRPVVIGGSILDIQVKALEDIQMDGRTLGGEVSSTAGGVGRNVADGLTRLQARPFFISAVGALGNDRALLDKMAHMDTTGVEVVEGARSATCIVLLEKCGECACVVGDMHVHRHIDNGLVEKHRDKICQAPILVLDGNINSETTSHILQICANYSIPVWFEPTDLSVAHRPFENPSLWKHCVAYASPNLNELRVMHNTVFGTQIPTAPSNGGNLNAILEEALELGRPLVTDSLHTLVVTLGSRGVLLITAQKGNTKAVFYPSLQADKVVSVSGAGDCFAAGMIACVLKGLDAGECVWAGQRAALTSLASSNPVPSTLNAEVLFHNAAPTPDPLILL